MTHRIHRTHRVGLVGLVLLLASACTTHPEETAAPGSPRIVQPGAPGEPTRELSADEVAELDVRPPEHVPEDVAFMQGMIVHHAQALEMTSLVPERADREDLALFAERMDISQRDEIDLMTSWLTAREEEVPDWDDEHAHHSHGELMPGMLTDAELAELRAASGPDFDRLFLTGMQRHHEGALQMVAELFGEGGGAELEIFQFANHVDADQRIELGRIAIMLEEMDAES